MATAWLRRAKRNMNMSDNARRDAIDVWDIETFDAELRLFLEDRSDLIRSYWLEHQRLFDEREAQTLRRSARTKIY